jgi:uncharacterized protein (DUF924 family)
MMTPEAEAILHFWFGSPGQEEPYAQRRKVWFGKQPHLDQEIRDRFFSTYQRAVQGEFTDWQTSPLGCLALILLFDQFSRHLFRDRPESFAMDEQAVAIARHAIAQEFDQQLLPLQRIFIYLPFEHSEQLADQERSVHLSQKLSRSYSELYDIYDYALRHQKVIQQFGRFPHRNKTLGRATTPAEAEFLKQPGSSF